MVESAEQHPRRVYLDSRRCQLDRQWEAVQSITDLRNRGSILFRHGESWLGHRHPVQEQTDGLMLHQIVETSRSVWLGHAHGRNRIFVFAIHTKRRSAGSQYRQPWKL